MYLNTYSVEYYLLYVKYDVHTVIQFITYSYIQKHYEYRDSGEISNTTVRMTVSDTNTTSTSNTLDTPM